MTVFISQFTAHESPIQIQVHVTMAMIVNHYFLQSYLKGWILSQIVFKPKPRILSELSIRRIHGAMLTWNLPIKMGLSLKPLQTLIC